MEVVARREITIEVEGDIKAAEVVKKYYELLGYTLFEENDEWIQLDKREVIRGTGRWR